MPISPIPYPDESGASFLMRTASANRHVSATQLLSHRYSFLKQRRLLSDIHDSYRFNQLLALLEVNIDLTKSLSLGYCNLTSRSGIFFENIIFPTQLFRADGIGFCPLCLKEIPYLRNTWRFKPYHGCLKHKIKILTECPQCEKTLNPLRRSIIHCNRCNYDISSARAPLVDIEPIEHLRELFSSHDQSIGNDFSYMWTSLQKIFADHAASIDEPMIMKIIYTSINNTYQAANIFKEVMDGIQFRLLEFSSYAIFSKDNVISKKFYEALNSTSITSRIQAVSKELKLSKKQACAILDISYAQLQTAIKNGDIEWTKSKKRGEKINADKISEKFYESLPTKKPAPLQSKNELEQYGYYSIKDASELLSVHSEIIRSLIHTSWLKAERKSILSHSRYLITREDMDEFNKKYICVGTIAKQLMENPTNLAEKLATLNIFPIDGPNIHGLKT
ncbi:MAG: hypothetical protein EOO43_18925, partial [Flavobacterium sp.]